MKQGTLIFLTGLQDGNEYFYHKDHRGFHKGHKGNAENLCVLCVSKNDGLMWSSNDANKKTFADIRTIR